MRTLLILGILINCVIETLAAEKWEGKAQFTAKIVDEDGRLIKGASVAGGFFRQEPVISGISDSNGLFVVRCDRAILGEAGFSVNHGVSGYYETHSGVRLQKLVNGRWEPWNPVVTAMVRRVINPIPMYAKAVEAMIPATDVLCGFDMETGDWVTPYGKGKQPDVFFQVDRSIVNKDDFELTFRVVFTNKLDGLQAMTSFSQSAFKSPRFAPVDGYKMEYERRLGRKLGRGLFNTEPSPEEYCGYRIRSTLDEHGGIKSAYYGKITSGFRLTGYIADRVSLLFTYYLNPTPNDRNLEFDPKRNLFTNLDEFETVSEP